MAVLISVIIPTCDRDEFLAICLTRLAPGGQSLSASHYEVIVTDDGLSNTTEALVRSGFPWAQWTRGPRRGPAANRNHGSHFAHGRWLVFTDDDCIPTAGWLNAFVHGIAACPHDCVFEGRTRPVGHCRHPLEICPVNENGGVLWSCNFAIDCRLFQSIGGFDERFRFATMEDTELRIRLRERGVNLQFVPEAIVEHPWRRIRNWPTHFARQVESQLLLEQIHPGMGFPSLPQIFGVHVRLFFKDHLPWLWRSRGTLLPVLARLWLSMAKEWYIAFRKPPPGVLNLNTN